MHSLRGGRFFFKEAARLRKMSLDQQLQKVKIAATILKSWNPEASARHRRDAYRTGRT